MIKINKVKADYFDYCDECGEVIDRAYMYDIKIASDEVRLCRDHFDKIKLEIKVLEFAESLD